eukprot:3322725-Amphidinium_carterae.1
MNASIASTTGTTIARVVHSMEINFCALEATELQKLRNSNMKHLEARSDTNPSSSPMGTKASVT